MEKKIIFAFEDSLANIAAYEKLNFNVSVDDKINGVFYVEADLTDYDWLAVLGLLEDCKRSNIQPNLKDGEKLIFAEHAIAYADEKAAGESLGFERVKN